MGGICIPKAENIHKHEHDKKHVMLYSFNCPNSTVWFSLLYEIFGSVCIEMKVFY